MKTKIAILIAFLFFSYSNSIYAKKVGIEEAKIVAETKLIQLRTENISKLSVEVINQRNSLWTTILNAKNKNSNSNSSNLFSLNFYALIGPLLETNWDQGYPYNIFLPDDPAMYFVSPMAVAMAQIVNYHSTINNTSFDDNDDYQVNVTGCDFWIDDDYIEYGFPSFPELNLYLDTLSMHYQNQQILTNNDIAALCFGCAIAVKQGNADKGSLDRVYTAYVRYGFEQVQLIPGYHPEIYNFMIQNITDSLPVHLSIHTQGGDMGHHLVIDGYNENDFFHLNFGWSGANNGWYLLPDQLPFGMTVIEGVIVNIIPNTSGIIENKESTQLNNLSIYPNPFKNKTRISFEVNENIKLQLAIYNINGTLVKMLTKEILIPGSYKLTWDGKTNSGIQLPPGIYFCFLKTGFSTITKKMIKLR